MFFYRWIIKSSVALNKKAHIDYCFLGWVKDKDSIENDEIFLYNDTRVKIERIEHEILTEEETTYNFEVEDYHSY